MNKYVSEPYQKHASRAEELLSVIRDGEVTPEAKGSRKGRLQHVLILCCCIIVILAGGKAFLYLESEISTVESDVGSVVKNIGTLKAQMSETDTRKQLAAVTTEVEDLRATSTQFRAEVKEIRDTLEALKARKTNVVPAQGKRR